MWKICTVPVLLSIAVTLVCCQPDAGSCNIQQVGAYVANNLEENCAASLSTALYANITSPGKDAELDTVCTPQCAGTLSNWLLRECNSRFNSTSLYYLCLRTANTATIGRYCLYATPPVYDGNSVTQDLITACMGSDMPGQCTDACAQQLHEFANQLGCCYQSLYNNTQFVQDAAAIGELAAADVTGLQVLGNRQIWTECGINPPANCMSESFAFPTAASDIQVFPQVITISVTLAGTVIPFL